MKVLAATLCALASGCAAVHPTRDPLPPAVVAPVQAVDLHLHLAMSHAAVPLFKGEPGDGTLTGSASTRLVNQVEAPHLHTAGLTIALGAIWTPLPLRPGRTVVDETLNQLDQLEAFCTRRPEFSVALSAEDVRAATASGRIAVVPQLEGAEGIETLADVDRFYGAGARVVTIVHFVDNAIGGAAQGQMAKNLLGLHPTGHNPQGLTEFGKAVIHRMVQLGMVVDLAHASDRVVEDTLAITEAAGVPVINSHTGARALLDMERNLSDDNAKRIAAGGGLIGVPLFTQQLETPDSAQLEGGHQHGTCDDVVAHWKHFATLTKPEAVMLGSDMNGFIARPVGGGSCPEGLRNTSDLPALWAALEANGVPHAALSGMGAVWLGLMERVEAKADPRAQAEARATRRAWLRASSHLFDAP